MTDTSMFLLWIFLIAQLLIVSCSPTADRKTAQYRDVILDSDTREVPGCQDRPTPASLGFSTAFGVMAPFGPLDNGPLACLVTSAMSSPPNYTLCLPPGTYELKPFMYDFPLLYVDTLNLPHGGRAWISLPDRSLYFDMSRGPQDSIFVSTIHAAANATSANLTLTAPIDPPVVCLFSEPDYRGSVKCFGPGTGMVPICTMFGHVVGAQLHGGAWMTSMWWCQVEGCTNTDVTFKESMSDPSVLQGLDLSNQVMGAFGVVANTPAAADSPANSPTEAPATAALTYSQSEVPLVTSDLAIDRDVMVEQGQRSRNNIPP